MFERYTEKARRVVFFGRYEASEFGAPYIETEHLLLGLLREDKALTARFIRPESSAEEIRKQIEANTLTLQKTPTSVDLPLSNESKRVLAYAAEEAALLGHRHIGTEHILLGLLREEKSFAAQLLTERGLRLSTVREMLAGGRTVNFPETIEPRGEGEGFVEFLGTDSVRIAVAGISGSAPVPRVGEIVVLELKHGHQRFRVRQVQYEYRLEPTASPDTVNALHRIRVYVTAAPIDNDREMWSHST